MTSLNAPHPPLPDLDRVQALTQDYARYSRSAGGLLTALAGLAALLAYGLGSRALLVTLPLAWLAAKVWLGSRYQPFGRVEERPSPLQRWTHVLSCAVLALAGAAILVLALRRLGPAGLNPRVVGYLAFVGALPIVAWFWLRSTWDFILGVYLFCQAALAAGGAPPQAGPWPLPFFGALAVLVGIVEHLRFRRLRVQIQELGRPR